MKLLTLAGRNKEEIFDQIERYIESQGLTIIDRDTARPWGGYLVIDEKQTTPFARLFFPEERFADIQLERKLSPKVLIVAPDKRLSWQYHHRRQEIWRVITGHVEVMTSDTDNEGSIVKLKPGDTIRLGQGERHRLIGTSEWGIVAEIWEHTDPLYPSNEDDIVRVQDDFGR